MALLLHLRQLEKGTVQLAGELSIAELEIEETDECIHLPSPLRYQLQAERVADSLLVRGQLELALDCDCVRCLKRFRQTLSLNDWMLELSLKDEDNVTVTNDCVDLTPFIREDILLAFPQHPLCDEGCNGLPYSSSSSLHQAENPVSASIDSSVWDKLNKLKF